MMGWGEETEHVLAKTADECDREYIHELRAEITRLRSLLPQPVEGLPTEPGWYSAILRIPACLKTETCIAPQRVPMQVARVQRNEEWVLVAVSTFFHREKPLFEYHNWWTLPLTPPDQLRDVTKMI